MKSDRELLEFAAKAGGYVVDEHTPDGAWVYVNGAEPNSEGEVPTFHWKPRVDDGDALRLAVKLMLFDSDLFMNLRLDETRKDPSRNDYEITRRAIVRAAAAIGETL